MKLLVAEINAYKNYVSREFFYIMTALIQSYGWNLVNPRSLCESAGALRQRIENQFGRIPDVILFWEAYKPCCTLMPELLRLPCRRCIFADDLHSWSDDIALIKHGVFYLFDRILATEEYVLDDFFPGLRAQKETIWIPHAASPDFLLQYNASPENAILLSGAINRYYPLRERLKALYDLGGHAIAWHPHPGYHSEYDYGRNGDIGSGYALRLNQYRAAFTDCSRYRYLVAKHFEIPATGALLVAEAAMNPVLGELGFVENVHYVSATADNLAERITHVLGEHSRQEIETIRRNGQKLVWDRHQTTDRARLIDEACADG
jgi:hypothetical protein